jgi:hypothetical protein
MSIEAQGVQVKRAGVIQKFDSSDEATRQLEETVMVKHSGEVVSTTEPIALEDALKIARELA